MAKTVDAFSTIEELRLKHNEVAVDLGDVSGLRTTNKDNLVDAMNSLQDKAFFFQEYIYDGTLNQVSFTGDDRFGNTLEFRDNRIQVFVRDEHLNETVDYNVSGSGTNNTRTTITLTGDYASGQTNAVQAGDKVVIYSFTGSFEGVSDAVSTASRFTLSDSNTIFNNNSNGVIINKNNTAPVTTLESGYNFQVNGKSFFQDDVNLAASKTLTAPTVNATTLLQGAELDINGNGDISGNLTVHGNATINGNLTLGDADTDNIVFGADVNSDIVPNTDDAYDLGSSSQQWRNLYIDGTAEIDTLALNGTTVTSTAAEINKLDGYLGGVTELNYLKDLYDTGVTASEYDTLDGITATTAELNVMDGNTTATATTIADADRVVVNDNGTMKQVAVTDLSAYFDDEITNMPNLSSAASLATVGALDSGSITSGFGGINNGSSTIQTTGTMQFGTLSDGSINITAFVDEDDMTSDSATKVPTQQSVKAYVDTQLAAQDHLSELGGDTDDITEGTTNLFYTDARVSSRTDEILNHSNHSNITASKVGDEIRLSAAAQYGDSNVTTYLSTRADAGLTVDGSGNLSAEVENGLILGSNASDKIQLDYEVISSGSLSGTPDGTGDAVGHLYFVI